VLRERRAPTVVAVAAADAAGAVAPSRPRCSPFFISSTDVHVVVFGIGWLVGDVVGRWRFVDLWCGEGSGMVEKRF